MTRNRVVWSEGMFLRPQHFQQTERFIEMLVDARTGIARPHGWGFKSLHLDKQALATGFISLRSAEGVFPDGTPFCIPQDYPAPPPLEVGLHVKNTAVLLALPARRAGMPEFSLDDGAEAALVRYVGTDVHVKDTVQDMDDAAEMKLGRLKLSFVLEDQPHNAFCTMAVARVAERRSGGQVLLDEGFIPPALQCQGFAQLQGVLEEVRDLVRDRARDLAGRLNQSAQKGVGEISDFMKLQAANRMAPWLDHLAATEELHPHALHGELSRLAGEFATFSGKFSRCARKYPAYRHNDLRGSFEPLVNDVRELLMDVATPGAVRLDLQERAKGLYTALVGDPELLSSATFVLMAKANMPAESLREQLPTQLKVGPPDKIRDLVMLALPGVPLVPQPLVPQRLPFYAGFCYFELDRRSELWKRVEPSRMLALYVAGDFPELQMEIWALRP